MVDQPWQGLARGAVRLCRRRAVVLALAGVALAVFGTRLVIAPPVWSDMLPKHVARVDLQMSLESFGEPIQVATFIPVTDDRQRVLEEQTYPGKLLFTRADESTGREGRWRAEHLTGRHVISYQALVATAGVRYKLPEDLPRPVALPPQLERWTRPTDTIQSDSPEIATLLESLRKGAGSVTSDLRAIFEYTADRVESADFKGDTDALTTLRLGMASCNGKSRLFAALTRRAGLPTRLVGGLVLDRSTKRTSHQWAEVWIGNRWVPFCPTNGYFAEIPQHYLSLYRGDTKMFRHTRDINFDYRFRIAPHMLAGRDLRAAVEGATQETFYHRLAHSMGVSPEVSRTFLMFPLAALVVIVFRSVVGLQTFGVFLPMLVAAAARHTGIGFGLGGFVVMVLLVALVGRGVHGLQILQVPRLAVLITVITLLVIAAGTFSPDGFANRLALLGLFPVVVLSFTAERIVTLVDDDGLAAAAGTMLATVVVALACYVVMSSVVLQSAVIQFPEMLLVVVALQLALGRWTGLRATEYLRFRRLIFGHESRPVAERSQEVLGLNSRNIEFLMELNEPEQIRDADDKFRTKTALEAAGVPTPQTLAHATNAFEMNAVRTQLAQWDEFVIKPARGSGGKGILVVTGRAANGHIAADGRTLDADALVHHMSEILAGAWSDGRPDEVMVESRIVAHGFFDDLAPAGLADLRIVLVNGVPLAAMLRLPTAGSGGRANLHQGGIGVPVALEDGSLSAGCVHGKRVAAHPETGAVFAGRCIPDWREVLAVALAAWRAVPLGYIGVDVSLDAAKGPLVLEVNARPGIEIQNVHGQGLRRLCGQLVDAREALEVPR